MAKKKATATISQQQNEGRYCVIGEKSLRFQGNVTRTWFKTPEGAERHAQNLLERNISNNNKDATLLVVQVVGAVGYPKVETRQLSTREIYDLLNNAA